MKMANLLVKLLLEQFLLEADEFAGLSIRSFQDRPGRVDTLIDKLKAGDALTLKKDSKPVVIDSVRVIRKDDRAAVKDKQKEPSIFTKDTFDELKDILPTLGSGDRLEFISGEVVYPITKFAKTTELGGKGVGGTLGPERAAIADLQKQFQEIGEPITITFGGKTYEGITGVVNVKENQKADFAFVADDDPVIFISYKPGTSVRSMISYGGVTKISEKSRDVRNFVSAIQSKVKDLKGLGYEFSAPLNDKGVALKAMYGSDFGSGTYGLNNVQAILQGTIKLTKQGGKYTIDADHAIVSPEIPEGDYTPVLNARFAGDRDQMGIKNCRIGIVPQGARTNVRSPFTDQSKKDDTSN